MIPAPRKENDFPHFDSHPAFSSRGRNHSYTGLTRLSRFFDTVVMKRQPLVVSDFSDVSNISIPSSPHQSSPLALPPGVAGVTAPTDAQYPGILPASVGAFSSARAT